MQIQNHTPVNIHKFGGLYSRGEFTDTAPPDYFIDSLNTLSSGDADVYTRKGFSKSITLANLRQEATYKRQGEASRLLVLDSTGKLFDTTLSLVTPILNIAAMTGFALLVYNNLAYISPHNGSSGLPGENVYVYNGTTIRDAAGAGSASGITVSVSASAGNIDAGTHVVGVCFETESGFITAPASAIGYVEVDGTKSIGVTLPLGPSGTVARRIIASRAIQDFNGDTEGYELYFLTRVADNSTTSATINFYDGDLQVSADYLFDQLSEIPACLFMTQYGKRACYGSTDTYKSLVYVSNPTEPESINSLAGFISFNPFESEGVKNAVEFRDSLYLTKKDKFGVTRDNGYEPSTWPAPTVLDGGVGANVGCIAQILDARGPSTDYFLFADESGLLAYNGGIVRPELSFNISNIWDRINKLYFYKVQLLIDPKNFLIYVNVPLDSATSPSHIIVGDFSDGLTADEIVWHIWTSAAFTAASITIDISNTTKKTYLRAAGFSGNVYDYDTTLTADDGSAIESYIQTALQFIHAGWVHHFGGVQYRIKGSGTLLQTLNIEDAVTSTSLPSLTLSTSPGREYFQMCNLNAEKCSVKIRMTSGYFYLKHIQLFARKIWATRPNTA